MDLNNFYKMQKELDETILNNRIKRGNKKLTESELFLNTVLALQVEVAELANATRCFKHWSVKTSEDKDILLDEYADIMHFFLSIGNQLGIKAEEKKRIDKCKTLIEVFMELNTIIPSLYDGYIMKKEIVKYIYSYLYSTIVQLREMLGFTEKEVENAYMIKNEINYRRQKAGY